MLRYRIVENETGRSFVLPALADLVRLEETYSTRAAAQDMADWHNLQRSRPAGATRRTEDGCSLPHSGAVRHGSRRPVV